MINLLVNPLGISGSFQRIWEMAQHLQDMALKIQACIEEVKYRCQVLDRLAIPQWWHWDPEPFLEYLPFPGHQISLPGPLGNYAANNFTQAAPTLPTPDPTPPPQRTPSPSLDALSEVWIDCDGQPKLAIDLTGGEDTELLYHSDSESDHWDESDDDW